MRLNTQEVIALEHIFHASNYLSKEIRARIESSTVTKREFTGVGFYSTINLIPPLEVLPSLRMWEFNFRHPAFPHGGSFMCSFKNIESIEIEAVALGGAEWPGHIDPTKFAEL